MIAARGSKINNILPKTYCWYARVVFENTPISISLENETRPRQIKKRYEVMLVKEKSALHSAVRGRGRVRWGSSAKKTRQLRILLEDRRESQTGLRAIRQQSTGKYDNKNACFFCRSRKTKTSHITGNKFFLPNSASQTPTTAPPKKKEDKT